MIKTLMLAGASSLFLAACQPASDGEDGNSAIANDSIAGTAAQNPDTPVSSDDPISNDGGSVEPGAPADEGPPPASSDCPILGSSGWAAWVNAMPGPNARHTLHVEGKVKVPTAGHSASLRLGPIAESYPLQVTVALHIKPPLGAAAEVVSTVAVKGQWAVDADVGSVNVRCGGKTVATISPVETVN